MTRLIFTLVFTLLSTLILAWWIDHPGSVTVIWQPWRIDTTFAVLVLLMLVLIAVALWLQGLVFRAKHGLPFFGVTGQLRRQNRGLDYLSRATVALAEGDARSAQHLIEKALELLPTQPMLRLLAAQAAKLGGDHKRAHTEYEALAEDRSVAFLGVRGLLMDAVAEGHDSEALRLASRARQIEPKSAWAIRTQFNLQIKVADWLGARKTLDAARKTKVFDRNSADSLEATLFYCQAKEADLAGDKGNALKLAKEALRFKSGFLPAALLAARLGQEKDGLSFASRILEKAWCAEPHPELALAFSNLAPMETSTARLNRFKKFIGKNSDPESLLQLAQYLMEAGHFVEARSHLEYIVEKTNLRRAYALLRELEEKCGASSAVLKELEEKAQAAVPESAWTCSSCGTKESRWSLHCSSCRMFNSLQWQRPQPTSRAFLGSHDDFLAILPSDAHKT